MTMTEVALPSMEKRVGAFGRAVQLARAQFLEMIDVAAAVRAVGDVDEVAPNIQAVRSIHNYVVARNKVFWGEGNDDEAMEYLSGVGPLATQLLIRLGADPRQAEETVGKATHAFEHGYREGMVSHFSDRYSEHVGDIDTDEVRESIAFLGEMIGQETRRERVGAFLRTAFVFVLVLVLYFLTTLILDKYSFEACGANSGFWRTVDTTVSVVARNRFVEWAAPWAESAGQGLVRDLAFSNCVNGVRRAYEVHTFLTTPEGFALFATGIGALAAFVSPRVFANNARAIEPRQSGRVQELPAISPRRLRSNGRCAACGSPAEKVCDGCKTTRYCSVSCQRTDWKTHADECA